MPTAEESTVATGTGGTAALLSHRTWGRHQAVTVTPAPASAASAVPAAPGPPEPLDDAEWQAIRQDLAGRYDEHARVVLRTLAEHPGLRAQADLRRTVGALVAVRAMRPDQPDQPGPDRAAGSALLDRAATIGLLRLPTVFGPVFGTGIWTGRTVGTRFRETGFVPATTRVPGDGTTVEAVIWSVRARRPDVLRPPGTGAVVFPPGSMFVVLAVEPIGPSGAPVVLVRELAGRSSRTDDEVAARLRSAHGGGLRP